MGGRLLSPISSIFGGTQQTVRHTDKEWTYVHMHTGQRIPVIRDREL